MELWKLSWGLALVLVAHVSAARGWCVKEGICADTAQCRNRKDNVLPRTKVHKCQLNGQTKGVYCKKEHLNLECITSSGEQGKCRSGQQIESNDIGGHNQGSYRMCFHYCNTNYYCYPDTVQKPAEKHAPKPTQREDAFSASNAFPNCTTFTGWPGKCVPLPLCDFLHTNMKGKNLEAKYKCPSKATDSTSVCCPLPKEEKRDNRIGHSKAKRLSLFKCGVVPLQNKVLEGSAASLGQYPWMANLMYTENGTNVTKCSGTLIHRRYVLTAAHCSWPRNGLNPIAVRLGEYDLSKPEDCAENVCAEPYQEYGIKNWIHHPKYKRNAQPEVRYPYDIALVELKHDAKVVKDQIYPICLPITKQWLMMKPKELTITGWGGIGLEKPQSDVLQEATLKIGAYSTHNVCTKEEVICVRGTNKEGSCKGDSGGPAQLITKYGNKFRMVLFGVISGGARNCSVEDHTPSLMVLVGYHMDWILDSMRI